MRFRFDRVGVSSGLLTICLLVLVRLELKWAATWRIRQIWVMDRVGRLNYESSIAFASLALDIIVLIVIWTSYQKRTRWAWFVMAVFICVYFVPVHLLDVFLDISRVGWHWWPGVVKHERFVVYAVDTGEVAEVTPDESGEEQSWTALSRWLNDCRWLSAEADALPSALTHLAG